MVYRIDKHLRVVTGCSALRTTSIKKGTVSSNSQWLAAQEFDLRIQYRPEICHEDALSRKPFEMSDRYDDVQDLQVNIGEDDFTTQ